MWDLFKDFCVIQKFRSLLGGALSAYLQGLGRGFGTNLLLSNLELILTGQAVIC